MKLGTGKIQDECIVRIYNAFGLDIIKNLRVIPMSRLYNVVIKATT